MASRRWDILSYIPLVAIVALVGLVAALVWIVSRSDDGRAANKLATDALWVEQTLRFQLAVDEDMLVRLALDAASGAPMDILQARARLHIGANPETLSVQWFDRAGALVSSVPEGMGPTGQPLVDTLLRSRATTARPVYGGAAGGKATIALRGSDGGVVVATISLPLMLDRHIPWWIAEQYAVRVSDTSTTLANRARRPVAAGAPFHTISFDPPLAGTVLTITAYDRASSFENTALVGAIIALAAFAVFTLLIVQRNAYQRRHAEQRLRAEMAFRRSMEESLTVGLRAKDHSGRILYVNAAFCKLVGLPADELIGQMPPMPYWSPDAIEETLVRQNRLATGPALPQSFESRFRRTDGTEIEVQVYEAPLIDASGRHHGWMGSVIDITEARRAARNARAQEDSLARTGRLVTMGEMASTLAHELNQPLGAIASYAAGGLNLIEAGQGESPMIRTAFEKLAAQARRAGLIIRRIQDFVKKREPQLVPLDLAEVAADAIGLMAAEARELRARLVLKTPERGLQPVLADRILIEQVMVNLIRNGMEAMAEGPSSGNHLTIRLTPEATAVRLDVSDQGPGIAEELAGHLYDPFTSTKSQGMGMGLNICRSIVELLHGSLSNAPNPGGGTVFTVRLPYAAPETAPTEGTQP
ncbi:PAS domain S-box protein [Frigidibacter albus]|uniref:histidine kinase n=1 Tax=Frigidibacter albus TaxID=1465486 RepID=A0A6L8VN10_9RHOB|nr:PAS domain S-box protein [Frigidibacter albus]MZQ90540.1 PAS domain S-box protein [Frigidibacter albus]NBE32340.1 PAS domain S-box protein [Frigidibacter albus]GGH59254.1 PAS domain-containing sensor histidine kinase [Frigidibacter albus]